MQYSVLDSVSRDTVYVRMWKGWRRWLVRASYSSESRDALDLSFIAEGINIARLILVTTNGKALGE